MDGILKIVRDPSWWFTTVFMGIIIGLVAAFTKDWLKQILSALSGSYRTRRVKQEKRENEYIEETADDPTLMIIALGEVILTFVCFGFMTMAATLFPIAAAQAQPPLDLRLILPEDAGDKFLLIDIMVFMFGIATSVTGYKMLIRLIRFKKVLKVYDEKKAAKTNDN